MALTHFSFADRVKLLWRGLFVQVFWNYRTMQGAGFLFALLPFLHRMESDPSKRKRLVSLSTGFMNTHPSLAPLAMGAMLRRMADDEGIETTGKDADDGGDVTFAHPVVALPRGLVGGIGCSATGSIS